MHARDTFIALLVTAAAQGMVLPAYADKLDATAPKRQLSGVSADEADRVIRQLRKAQEDIRAGKSVTFELISGSIASWKQSNISPRSVFLQIPFQSVWSISFSPDDRSTWKTYRLSYAPDGLGKLYWDVEVNIGVGGEVERILLVYMSPPPF